MTGQYQPQGGVQVTSEAFAERIADMTQTLFRVSYTLISQPCDREDAVQECLRKAWQKRDRLRDDRYMQTWLIRILINECYNILRRKGRREMPLSELPERAAPPDADPALHDALMALPEAVRLPIVLHYIEGYKTEEIARMLNLPQNTVKSRMLKGRRELKILLSEEVRYEPSAGF
jgi:RNA polymerase sigma-70 factor (ECF subfamily)